MDHNQSCLLHETKLCKVGGGGGLIGFDWKFSSSLKNTYLRKVEIKKNIELKLALVKPEPSAIKD